MNLFILNESNLLDLNIDSTLMELVLDFQRELPAIVDNSNLPLDQHINTNVRIVNSSMISIEKISKQAVNTESLNLDDEEILSENDEEILKHSSGHLFQKRKKRRGGRKVKRWRNNYRNRLLKLKAKGKLDAYKDGELNRFEKAMSSNIDELDYTIEQFASNLF